MDDKAQHGTTLETESAYTPEQLQEMKRSGQPKPANVKQAEWDQPQKLSYKHIALIDRALVGLPTRSIASELGWSTEHVRKLLRSPMIQEELERRRSTAVSTLVRDKMHSMAGKALSALEDIMDDPQARASSKIDAAKFTLEQIVGKSKQPVEHTGSLQIELRRQIAELDARMSREVTETAPTDKPKTAFEEFLSGVIAADFVVGKKSEAEGDD